MSEPKQDVEIAAGNERPSGIPEPGTRPHLSDVPWLLRYSFRGLLELVRARIAFARFSASDIPRLNAAARSISSDGKKAPDWHIERVGYVLPRLSARLPWRSDCLIQAMAGHNWLMASGVPSEIQIGVEKPEGGRFGAHAWLVHGGKIVTGGEIDRYARILGDDPVDE